MAEETQEGERCHREEVARLKESYVFMSSSMRYCSSTTTLVRLGLR